MAEWFSDWFDSKYYHILYKNRDYKEAQDFLGRLMSHLKFPGKSKILDLACGKGRHSVYLNGLGYEVVGLDLSKNSIAEANLTQEQNLRFDVHDMRFPFPYAPYDLILNLFTSFGYFNNKEEDIKTLTNITNALTPDGIFVMDFLNIRYIENNIVTQEEKLVDGIYFKLKRFIKSGSLYKTISFKADGKEFYFQERVDALKYFMFEEYFETVGLEIVEVFGDYALNTFDIDTSKRVIFITKKK